MYYQHSGKAPVASLAIGFGAGLATAVILGALYAYIILYLPIAGYVTFLISGGYGALCGFVAASLLKRGKVRHPRLSLGIALLGQAVGFYTAWAVWVYALVQRAEPDSGFTLGDAFNPTILWSAVTEINKVGAWEMSGTTPTGGVLWVLWGLEALIIFGGTYLLAAGVFAGEVFCERCQRWCAEEKGMLLLETGDLVTTKTAFEHKRFDGLIPLRQEGIEAFTSVDLRYCPDCRELSTVTVRNLTVTLNKEGKPETKEQEVLSGLLVSREEADRLRGLEPPQA